MFVCEEFSDSHNPSRFDSGEVELDDWLRSSALDSDGRRITRTYVFHEGDGAVVGYYAVMPFVIERGTLTRRQGRGLPDRIPGYLLAKLAVDRRLQGRRLGSQLLASALERLALAAEGAGGRFVVVDAISPSAVDFYVHHGLQPIAGAADRLLLPVKDVTAWLLAQPDRDS